MLVSLLRWLVPSLVPALLLAVVVVRSDRTREPLGMVAFTFTLGGVLGWLALFVEGRVATLADLSLETRVAGETGALVFTFALAAPLREAAKVAATWMAFRSRHFDEAYDGLVYPAAAALGFAAVENALMLRASTGAVAFLRAAMALPAHVFFACAWGYALGRARVEEKRRASAFPLAWLASTLTHALYLHFVYGRGPGAIVAAVPLLLAMALVTWIGARDLRRRDDAPSRLRLSRLSVEVPHPPSFKAVRAALSRADQPILAGWIALGALTSVGAMLVGIGAAVAVGHYAHVDFAAVDEQDLGTTLPVAVLGVGLLASFPVSGYLVARASGARTLLEPALGTAIALVLAVVSFGAMAPTALVFAVAFTPIAFALACLGAWVGRAGPTG
ncbi:MAG: PrsW family glutamic-type intramembrane protease [Polyangiaceae bacterium]